MKTVINRIIGLALVLAAIAGLLFNAAGVILVWRYKQPVTASIVNTLQMVSSTIGTTVQALDVTQASLKTAMDSAVAVENTINSTAKTIQTSTPIVDTLAQMMKKDLPNTISSAQTSLTAAQESAKIIDSVLKALTSIPFVSKNLYNPPVPLDVALGQVSASLDSLPKSFMTMGDSLTSAGGNLETMQTDVTLIAANIRTINTSLESAQLVITQYRTQVSELQNQLEGTVKRLPDFLNTAAWVLTFFFVWLALTQIGLLFQGMEMLGYRLIGDEQDRSVRNN